MSKTILYTNDDSTATSIREASFGKDPNHVLVTTSYGSSK
jgi:hypothetical protein